MRQQHTGDAWEGALSGLLRLGRDSSQKAPGPFRNSAHLVHYTVEFPSFLSSRLKHPLSPALASFPQGSGHSLGPQGEGGAGDGRGQVQAFGDLPPDLLVDDLHQAPLLRHQLIQHIQVQDLLGHDGDSVDGGPCDCAKRETEGCVITMQRKKTSVDAHPFAELEICS